MKIRLFVKSIKSSTFSGLRGMSQLVLYNKEKGCKFQRQNYNSQRDFGYSLETWNPLVYQDNKRAFLRPRNCKNHIKPLRSSIESFCLCRIVPKPWSFIQGAPIQYIFRKDYALDLLENSRQKEILQYQTTRLVLYYGGEFS